MFRSNTTFAAGLHGPSPLHAAVDTLQRWWWAYLLHRSQRATVMMLSSLDRRVLHDIGLDRSEIESVVYSGGCERRRAFAPRRG